MKKRTFITLYTIVLSIAAIINSYSQNYNSLSWRMNTAYFNYLMRDVHQQYAERKVNLDKAYESKEAMIAYRDGCIKRYKSIVGEFPEKNDLNAEVVGVTEYIGFRIEKIIFESVPKRYVTANLYLPAGDGPFPVAVDLCGHGLGGKIPAHKSAILFAQNGIAVMVVDPIGQGERIQFVDENSKTLTRGATTEHTLLNAGANLLGSSVAAYEYWDNHRAIDYLETRKDIDKEKIGVYGSSGGGTQTSYLVGLEPRVKVASVCSYFSKRERVLELYGASDGCQHIPYEGREQLEIADFVLMMTPKPVLIMSGLYDFVDYWGAQQAFKELEQTYTVLGSPEKVKMFTIEGGHGMPQPKREALITWFRTWLVGDDTPIKETEDLSIPAEDLQCTSTSQVNTAFEDKVSIPEYHLSLANQYKKERKNFVAQGEDKVKEKVLQLLGITMPDVDIQVEETGVISSRNYDFLKYQINRPGQMPVPCVVVLPETIDPESSITLYLNEGGKNDILSEENTVDAYANRKEILVVADLRGFGELSDPMMFNDTKYWNREYRNAMISMHIGKPVMGQRVIDIMTLIDFIKTNDKLGNHDVKIVANGSYGPAVVHASFLDDRISNAEISRSIKSFTEYLENPMQREVYSNVLYGVLKYYDLKDLVQLSGKNRVKFID